MAIYSFALQSTPLGLVLNGHALYSGNVLFVGLLRFLSNFYWNFIEFWTKSLQLEEIKVDNIINQWVFYIRLRISLLHVYHPYNIVFISVMQPLVMDDVVSNAAVCQQQDILLNFEHQIQNRDRKSTRLNSSHANISYAVFCLKKKKKHKKTHTH